MTSFIGYANKFLRLCAVAMILFSATDLFAAPRNISFQSKIYKPDGTPLASPNVQFKFSLMNTLSTCVIYTETFTGVDLSASAGSVVLTLGSGTRSYPVAGGMQWYDAFNNATSSYTCQAAGTYSPALIDSRRLVMQFNDGGGWQTLPPMDINSVPFSMFAENSEKVGGRAATDFVLASALPTCSGAQVLRYDGTNFSCVAGAPASISPAIITAGGASAGQVLKWNGTNWVASADDTGAGGTVSNVSSTNLYLSVANPNSNPAFTLNVGTAANTVAAGNDARFSDARIPTGAASGDLAGTYPNPTIAAGAVSDSKISDVAWSKITGKPTTLAGYSISDALVRNAGSGSGNVITSIQSGTNASKGAGGTDGRIFVATDTQEIYRDDGANWVKVAGVSAGGSLVAANNLSDLANAGTARSNLGLGGSATLNVGTGAGTVAAGNDSRFTDSRVPSGAASGDLAGTYPNPTIAAGAVNDSKISDVAWSKLTGRPNTVAGYSISDAISTATVFSGDVSGTQSAINVNKLKGQLLNITALANNNILQYNGTDYVNRAIPMCGANNYLTFNGTTWSCSADVGAGGMVTSVSATSPLQSSGGATPTISLAQANATTDGFLSSGDWNTFNNKQAALGYVPLAPLNNLSDVANAGTARTNLGLGGSATLNVGTGAGTVAAGNDARFTDSRVPSGAASGDLAGTYPNPTIAAGAVNDSKISDVAWSKVTGKPSLINSVAVSSPIQSTGGATPTISILQAGAASHGYLSSGDWNTFNSKQAALGYSPLAPANNLSELANATTARSNLGLGTAATLNYAIGDAGVGEAVRGNDSRLTNSRAPMGAAAGDLDGNYPNPTLAVLGAGGTGTKITYDTKGRVTASANLISSDITSALGYTPISSQWATYSGDISYVAGNVGIGVTNPGTSLDIVGPFTAAYMQMKLQASGADDRAGLSFWSNTGTRMGAIYSSKAAGNETLHIAQEVNNSPIIFANTVAGSTAERMRIDGNGKVGIGTPSPTAALSVSGDVSIAGQLKITGGSPGANKVLTSNAAGLATWETPAATGVTTVSGGGPVQVATGSTTPVITVDDATTGAKGIMQVGTGLSVSSGTVSVAYGTTGTTAAVGNDSRITGAAQKSNNLSDLADASTARTNLGLGGAATLNVGTGAGTVMAGNDGRIANAIQKDGSVAMTGDLNMGGRKIASLSDPTAATDAVTKQYVDAAGTGGGGGNWNVSCTSGWTGYNFMTMCTRVNTVSGNVECNLNTNVNGYGGASSWGACSGGAPFGGGSAGVSASVDLPSGYFVKTYYSYNGNLGGIAGANATCLNELTTYPWKGKTEAVARGLLVAGKVKAFICDGSTCNIGVPFTRYQFAKVGSSTAGGDAFATGDTGAGPNDSSTWSAGTYFGDSDSYWTGRVASNASSTASYKYSANTLNETLWDSNMNTTTYNCSNWSNATTAAFGGWGSGSGNQASYVNGTARRWGSDYNGNYYSNDGYGTLYHNNDNSKCNAARKLVCFVHP